MSICYIVSWDGMPFFNSKYSRKKSSCSLQNSSISSGSLAYAIIAKNEIPIISLNLCNTLLCCRVSKLSTIFKCSIAFSTSISPFRLSIHFFCYSIISLTLISHSCDSRVILRKNILCGCYCSARQAILEQFRLPPQACLIAAFPKRQKSQSPPKVQRNA